MKRVQRRKFLGIIILFSIVLTYLFFRKNEVEHELICEIPVESEFYPMGYVFFHNSEYLNQYYGFNSETKMIKEKMCKSVVFDFERYSYCIVYGKPTRQIYHSYKSTFFDDPTPSYARTSGKIPVFINYQEQGTQKGYIYLYRIRRNERLRGMEGL